MATCQECKAFFPLEASEPDYAEGKGDCVRELFDGRSKYWASKPIMGGMEACPDFNAK